MVSEKRLKKIVDVVNARKDIVVVFEDIHDPHNAEAIMRSCDAFGVQDIYLIFEKSEPFNPRKIGKQSSSSANKWLSFHFFRSSKECVDFLKGEGYTIVATDMGGDNLFKAKIGNRKFAIFVGNEHRGLSDYVIDNADLVLSIPMKGMVESLNVSVSAAVFLSHFSQKVKRKLSSTSKKNLIEEFSNKGKASKRLS